MVSGKLLSKSGQQSSLQSWSYLRISAWCSLPAIDRWEFYTVTRKLQKKPTLGIQQLARTLDPGPCSTGHVELWEQKARFCGFLGICENDPVLKIVVYSKTLAFSSSAKFLLLAKKSRWCFSQAPSSF